MVKLMVWIVMYFGYRKVFQRPTFWRGQLRSGSLRREISQLAEHTDLKFYKDLKPTVRDSSYLIVQDSKMTNVNSSSW
jgi:hypothetical protein